MKKDLEDYKVISVPTTIAEMIRQEKEHKALEIIKKKLDYKLTDHFFGIENNYCLIIKNCGFEIIKINEEEYDLLKEVL